MYGKMLLESISNCAAEAADMYPQIVRVLIDAGVPPDDVQVIGTNRQQLN